MKENKGRQEKMLLIWLVRNCPNFLLFQYRITRCECCSLTSRRKWLWNEPPFALDTCKNYAKLDKFWIQWQLIGFWKEFGEEDMILIAASIPAIECQTYPTEEEPEKGKLKNSNFFEALWGIPHFITSSSSNQSPAPSTNFKCFWKVQWRDVDWFGFENLFGWLKLSLPPQALIFGLYVVYSRWGFCSCVVLILLSFLLNLDHCFTHLLSLIFLLSAYFPPLDPLAQ